MPEPISTQVIPRDRHAMYFATLGVIASSVERLATEIRHLQRTEVLEAEEFFSEGQKGSSAMPHKRNPVLSENLTGLARMVRAYVTPASREQGRQLGLDRFVGGRETDQDDGAARRDHPECLLEGGAPPDDVEHEVGPPWAGVGGTEL